MLPALHKFIFVFDDPYRYLRDEKEKGKKIIGVTPMYFPLELVHAAGATPVILQASREPVTLGYHHYHHFFCGITRGIVDLAIKGKLDFLDALVLSDMCFEMRHVADPLRRLNRYPLLYMQWPLEADPDRWKDFTVRGLEKVSSRLEEITGMRITDEEVAKSVSLYNQNRALLRRIYTLRKTNPGALTAKQMSAIVISCMVMPVEDSNEYLRELVVDFENAKPYDNNPVKVFLSGHLCHGVKEGILDLVENSGGMAVGDDLYTGRRYYHSDVELNGPYQEVFALQFLNRSYPCPTQVNHRLDWADYLIDGTKTHGAKGIIMFLAKNCEPHMIAYAHVKERLESAEIPYVLIEVEHEMVSIEGTRTRIQAFIEMLKGRVI